MNTQFRFDDINQVDLKHHLHHLVQVGKNNTRAELLIKEIDVLIPIVINTYKTKKKTISLLIRSGSVGRKSLEKLHEWAKSEGLNFQVRKSTKRKLVSQLKIQFPCDTDFYTLEIASVLKIICIQLGTKWPTELAIGYYEKQFKHSLPGIVSSTSMLWRAGNKLGQLVGKILNR